MSPAHTPLERVDYSSDLSNLVDRITSRLIPDGRLILGLVGAPGAGKSTIAEDLAIALGTDTAIVVPMDGFHIASGLLRDPSQTKRRGAIDTFDPGGYVCLLQRIRNRTEDVVYAPAFDRRIENPIAGAIAVARQIPIVITEGNYLLCDEPLWSGIRPLLDETWFVEVDPELRRERLVARHRRSGKSETDAAAFADGSDEVNARIVTASRVRADLIVRLN